MGETAKPLEVLQRNVQPLRVDAQCVERKLIKLFLDQRDDKTLNAIITVCQLFIREYSNGQTAVERALLHWKGRPETSAVLQKAKHELRLP